MVKAMKLQLFYHMTKIDCASSHHEQFNQIINRSNIIITGNNNHVSMHFDSEENVEKLLFNISRKTKCSTFAKHFVPKSHLLTQFKM